MAEHEMKFTDLDVDNLFDACALLDAIGMEEIMKAFDAKEINGLFSSGQDTEGIGMIVAMKICGIVIRYLPKAKNEVYTFFSNCMVWDDGTAVTVDEIRSLGMAEFMKLINDFFRRPDLMDFFKEVVAFVGLDWLDSGTPSTTDTATAQIESSAVQSGSTI